MWLLSVWLLNDHRNGEFVGHKKHSEKVIYYYENALCYQEVSRI